MAESGLPTSKTLKVYDSILDTIGNTPLVRLSNIGRNLTCQLYAKIEFFNPGGSVKDRIGLNIIEEAEKSGRLKPGGTVVESTSGNTGLVLAIICTLRGYKSVFVIPDKMSQEKIQLLRAYGAKVIITPYIGGAGRPALLLQRCEQNCGGYSKRDISKPISQS